MAISFNNGTHVDQTASLSHTVNAPSGVLNNDVIILLIAWNGSPGTVTPDGTWTSMYAQVTGATNPMISGYWRVWHTGDSITWTWTTTTSVASSQLTGTYTGVDTTTPMDATAVTNFFSTTTTTLVCLSITTVTANAWILGGEAINASNPTVTVSSTDLTLDVDDTSGTTTTPTGKNAAFGHVAQTVAGASGDKNITSSGARAYASFTAALRPATAGGTQSIAGAESFTGASNKKTNKVLPLTG